MNLLSLTIPWVNCKSQLSWYLLKEIITPPHQAGPVPSTCCSHCTLYTLPSWKFSCCAGIICISISGTSRLELLLVSSLRTGLGCLTYFPQELARCLACKRHSQFTLEMYSFRWIIFSQCFFQLQLTWRRQNFMWAIRVHCTSSFFSLQGGRGNLRVGKGGHAQDIRWPLILGKVELRCEKLRHLKFPSEGWPVSVLS